MSSNPVAAEAPVTIYRTYDDGYVVRSMRPDDATIVQSWYCGMGIISRHDLNTALQVFPASSRGFYIGEFEGRVVASAVRLPWADDVFYGSYYYVDKPYRTRGFGTRLRDEVAFEHISGRKLCVDAVLGKVADTNRDKFGYKDAWKTGRFICTAKQSYEPTMMACVPIPVVSVDDVAFNKIIEYDNKCFINRNFAPRREFLRRWTQIQDGVTYVALSEANGHVIGYGCRRPAIQSGNHLIGPLYADNRQTAAALISKLCSDVRGDSVTINIWYANEDAVSLMNQFEFVNVFDLLRMHANGDAHEYKPQVFALTSIDVCGF
jgi:GNAT superfamily N-acetyltransferase